jgi:hypothetical protein
MDAPLIDLSWMKNPGAPLVPQIAPLRKDQARKSPRHRAATD